VVLGIGYLSMHWLAVLGGGPPLIAFLCLLLGVSTWTSVLRAPMLKQWTATPVPPAATSAAAAPPWRR
jgi:hypothetical protein